LVENPFGSVAAAIGSVVVVPAALKFAISLDWTNGEVRFIGSG